MWPMAEVQAVEVFFFGDHDAKVTATWRLLISQTSRHILAKIGAIYANILLQENSIPIICCFYSVLATAAKVAGQVPAFKLLDPITYANSSDVGLLFYCWKFCKVLK